MNTQIGTTRRSQSWFSENFKFEFNVRDDTKKMAINLSSLALERNNKAVDMFT